MLKKRVRKLEQTHRRGTDIERELRVLTDEALEALIANQYELMGVADSVGVRHSCQALLQRDPEIALEVSRYVRADLSIAHFAGRISVAGIPHFRLRAKPMTALQLYQLGLLERPAVGDELSRLAYKLGLLVARFEQKCNCGVDLATLKLNHHAATLGLQRAIVQATVAMDMGQGPDNLRSQ